MKFARYEIAGDVSYGVVEGDSVARITGTPFGKYEATEETHPLSDVKLLAPCDPGKVIAIGLNYASHLGDMKPPEVPEPFLKTPSAVIGPGGPIVIPSGARQVEEEGELTVVIGRRCKGATRENALSYVLGYTCGNDVSAREWQDGDLQWWRAKSSDTFAPLGPYIATDIDPGNLNLQARVNGEVEQDSNTSDLIHGVPRLVEFVSAVMTLEAGDVIMTGTPGHTGGLNPGDTVEIEIEGIGVLSNTVAAA